MIALDHLATVPTFWYLASLYTKHPGGIDTAHREVCQLAAKLLEAGVPVFSPIAHTHTIGLHCKKGQFDHDFWMEIDAPFMRTATGILVVTSPGWQGSRGIAHEIAYFEREGKTIVYLNPKTLEVTQ